MTSRLGFTNSCINSYLAKVMRVNAHIRNSESKTCKSSDIHITRRLDEFHPLNRLWCRARNGQVDPIRYLVLVIILVTLLLSLLPTQAMADSIMSSALPAAIKPSSGHVHSQPTSFHKGVQFARTGDYHAALISFSKAIQHDLSHTDAYANRCLIYIHLNHYHEAIADCDRAIQLQPNHINAYLNRGLARYRKGQELDAVSDFTRVLEQRPYNVRARYNRGLALSVLGDHQQAIADFNQALRHASSDDDVTIANIYNDRGLTQLQQGNVGGAIADLSLSIRLNAALPQTYYNRACAYHQHGQFGNALQDFTTALQLDSQFAQAYFNRGMLYRQLGRQEQAIADLQMAAHEFAQHGEQVAQQNTIKLIRQMQSTRSAVG